jgi:hypothetical protein
LHADSSERDLWAALASGATRCIRGGTSQFVRSVAVERMINAGCPVETLPTAGHFVHVDALTELVERLTDTIRRSP